MDGKTYQSGAASLFASAARVESLFDEAKQFVEKRQAITTKMLREGLAVDALQASQLMHQLEEASVIAGDWDVSLGGYPVLTFKSSHWVGGGQ